MAKEPTDLTTTILQNLQSDMAEVRKALGEQSQQLSHIDEQVADLKLQFTYTLGLAAGADFKAQTASRSSSDTDKRIDELIARLEELEKTR